MSTRAEGALAAVAAMTAAAAVATGCSAAPAGDTPPTLNVTPRPKADGTVAFPLDYVLPTEAEERLTTRARDILARACLRRYGFEIDKPVIPAGSGLVTQTRSRLNDGFVTEAQAHEHGFHPVPPSEPEEKTSLPAKGAVLHVLNGWWMDQARTKAGEPAPPKTYKKQPIAQYGCAGEAHEKLSEGVPRPVAGESPGGALDALNYVESLRRQADEKVKGDKRVKDVTAKWAACYREKTGDSAASPLELARDTRWQSEAEPTKAEIQAALASSRCQLKVNYLGVVNSLTAAYEEEIAETNRPTLSAIATFFRARTKNATSILKQDA